MQLTKSIVAARADTGDVMIQTQVRRDVNIEQTNMAAGNGSVSAKLKYRIPATLPTQRGTLKCFFFFLVRLWHVPMPIIRCCRIAF